MGFPLEKILTISATEYASVRGFNLTWYSDARGVQIDGVDEDHNILAFVSKHICVPDNTEVIVGYHTVFVREKGKTYFHAEGTALISKVAPKEDDES